MKLSIPIDNTDDPIRYVFLSEYDHTNLATLRVPVYLSLDVRWLSDISIIIPLLSLFELPEWGGLVVLFYSFGFPPVSIRPWVPHSLRLMASRSHSCQLCKSVQDILCGSGGSKNGSECLRGVAWCK